MSQPIESWRHRALGINIDPCDAAPCQLLPDVLINPMPAPDVRVADAGSIEPAWPIPSPLQAQVWIDFDGTITRKDVLDELILAFGKDDSWRAVEARWQAGEIGSFDCLREEFDVLRVDAPRLNQFLQAIPIDPGAASLFRLLKKHHISTAILSDGIETFISLILQRENIEPVTIRSNRITHVDDRLGLVCPHRSPTCETNAAHCKCASIATLGVRSRTSIYIGDGRSDLCPARKADIVFAKNALARIFCEEGRPFIPFETLNDVKRVLANAWSNVAVSS